MGMLELVKEHTLWCQDKIGQIGIRVEEQLAEIVSRSTTDYSAEEKQEIGSRLSASAHKSYFGQKLRHELAIGRKYLVSGEMFSDDIKLFRVTFQDFIIGVGLLDKVWTGEHRYSVCYCDPEDTRKGLWNDRFARGLLAYRLLESLSSSENMVSFSEGESDFNKVRFVLYKLMVDALGNKGIVPNFFKKRVSIPGYVERGMGFAELYAKKNERDVN
jgi:hypothetical protein